MKIAILDSYNNENLVQLFTKPLRGVLGGRQIASQTVGIAQKEAIFNVWQRVLIAIILCTIAIPYTFLAAAVLVGKAMTGTEEPILEGKKNPFWLSDENNKVLAPIFEGSKINLQKISSSEALGIIDAEDLIDEIQILIVPTFTKVNIGNSCMDYVVIPLLQETGPDVWKKEFLLLSKHPHDSGPQAFWYGSLATHYNFKIPLSSRPDPIAIQPMKDLLEGKIVTIQNIRFKLF